MVKKSSKSVGYVYILSNPAMPEYLKIGYTMGNVAERAAQLSNTSVPLPYKVEHSEAVEFPTEIESLFHARFANYRVAQNREFFKMGIDHAIEEISVMLYGTRDVLKALGLSLKNLVYLVEKYPDRWNKNLNAETLTKLLKIHYELHPDSNLLEELEKDPRITVVRDK